MADFNLRAAERLWQSEQTLQNWMAYLLASKRAGEPIFTAPMLAEAADCEVINFRYTDQGFHAQVRSAQRPALEGTYSSHWGELEGFPLWGSWQGEVQVEWSGDMWEPQGPMLLLNVQGETWPEEITEEITDGLLVPGVYYYEADEVANEEDLRFAFLDTNNDNWQFPF